MALQRRRPRTPALALNLGVYSKGSSRVLTLGSRASILYTASRLLSSYSRRWLFNADDPDLDEGLGLKVLPLPLTPALALTLTPALEPNPNQSPSPNPNPSPNPTLTPNLSPNP